MVKPVLLFPFILGRALASLDLDDWATEKQGSSGRQTATRFREVTCAVSFRARNDDLGAFVALEALMYVLVLVASEDV